MAPRRSSAFGTFGLYIYGWRKNWILEPNYERWTTFRVEDLLDTIWVLDLSIIVQRVNMTSISVLTSKIGRLTDQLMYKKSMRFYALITLWPNLPLSGDSSTSSNAHHSSASFMSFLPRSPPTP